MCSPLGRTSAPTRGLESSLTLGGGGIKKVNIWAYSIRVRELGAGGALSCKQVVTESPSTETDDERASNSRICVFETRRAPGRSCEK